MVTFSQELFDDICTHISEGRSLRSICAQSNMPSTAAFMKWLNKDPALVEQYARAMESRGEHMFEDMLTIADNTEKDIIVLEDGREIVDHNVVSRDKLRIDTRKWILSRMNPKKYGDKAAVDVTSGGDKIDNTLVIKHVDMSKPE